MAWPPQTHQDVQDAVSTLQSTTAALPASAGAAVAAFGDSITGRSEPYLAYAAALSGKFRVTGIYSNPGYTSAQLVPVITQVTQATDKPAVCILLCGANDAGVGTSVGTYGTNITTMVAALRAANIYPVLGTITPQSSSFAIPYIQTYNVWLQRYAARNQIPLVPFNTALTAMDGTFASGYDSGDGVHPSVAGLKVMGQQVANTLTFLSTDGLLATTQGGINLVPNGLLTADTNSDGWPDTWTVAAQTGLTVSLGTRTGVPGQIWSVALNAVGSSPALNGAAITTGFSPGDRLRISAWTESVQDGGWNNLQVGAFNSNYSTQTGIYSIFSATGAGGFSRSLTGLVQQEIVVPASTANLVIEWQVGPGTGTYRLGQLGVWNLTALGIA